jgi:hypothetical protein
MWQDYIGLIPGIAAAIMAALTLQTKEMPRWKKCFVAILTLIAVGGTGFSGWWTLHQKQVQEVRQTEIRDTLGNLMAEGLSLIAPGCADPANTTPPVEAVNAWRDRVVAYLGGWLGRSYVQRLNNIPPGFTTNVHCDNGHYSGVVRTVVETNTHLEQFSQQPNF